MFSCKHAEGVYGLSWLVGNALRPLLSRLQQVLQDKVSGDQVALLAAVSL